MDIKLITGTQPKPPAFTPTANSYKYAHFPRSQRNSTANIARLQAEAVRLNGGHPIQLEPQKRPRGVKSKASKRNL